MDLIRPYLERDTAVESITHSAIFVCGLAVLYVGAETLVKGAVRLARAFGVSPLVIGLTLVAFGTSTPELSLDLTAAFKRAGELAFGDLVGSNIANVGLILGVAALIRPLRVQMRVLRIEVPIVIGTSLGVWILAADGHLGRLDGAILVACFVAFLVSTYRLARRESPEVREQLERQATDRTTHVRSLLLVLAGLVGLVIGAQLMVHSAVEMARGLGVSELVIGLTIVAVGTSLPELATSIVAARRGESDIVVGNVLGSNIVNILCVLGLVTQVQPLAVQRQSLAFDLPAMAVFAVAMVPIMRRGKDINRIEGAALVAAYAGFLIWQVS